MTEKPKQRIISEAGANVILNYLATKPYSEVYTMVAALQAMPKYEEPEKAPEAEKPDTEEKKDAPKEGPKQNKPRSISGDQGASR